MIALVLALVGAALTVTAVCAVRAAAHADERLADLGPEPDDTPPSVDDLVAIIAAVQDGHVQVDNPADVIAACDLSLWELERDGAA